MKNNQAWQWLTSRDWEWGAGARKIHVRASHKEEMKNPDVKDKKDDWKNVPWDFPKLVLPATFYPIAFGNTRFFFAGLKAIIAAGVTIPLCTVLLLLNWSSSCFYEYFWRCLDTLWNSYLKSVCSLYVYVKKTLLYATIYCLTYHTFSLRHRCYVRATHSGHSMPILLKMS